MTVPDPTPDPGAVPPAHPGPIMDAAECAAFLRLASPREVLRLARRRELPSVRVGRRRLFLLESVLAALREREDRAIADRELG